MGGDDLDDLLLGDAEARLELRGRGEVAALPVAARKRLVGDAADEVLEEAVLAALGQTGVGLDAQTSFRTRPVEKRVELGLGQCPRARPAIPW